MTLPRRCLAAVGSWIDYIRTLFLGPNTDDLCLLKDFKTRLVGHMKTLLSNMNKYYNDLSDKQAEYLTMDPSQPGAKTCREVVSFVAYLEENL